ncbi:MAG: VanZ family protein [Betaproteobacteria bacterium]|jgi:VanZ family protein
MKRFFRRRTLSPSADFNRDGRGQRSLSVMVAAFMVMLVAYASLYPFEGWRWPTGVDWTSGWQLPWPRWRDRADEWLNLLGYVPVGMVVAVALLRRGLNPLLALVLGMALPALLSYSMELLQMLLPRRVPSLKDWAGNTLGAAMGALLAWALHRSGWLRGARILRDRWFSGESAGALVLLLLWPVALLAPSTLPFGLGQCWDEVESLFLWVLGQLPLSAWGLEVDVQPAALAGEVNPPSTPAQILAIALGALSPLALCCAAMSAGLKRLVPMLAMATLALASMTLSTALNFGPGHALSWLTPGAWLACALCIPLALPFVWLPRRWCAALALLILAVGVALGAQMPTGAYHALNLQAWEQGRFIRFHGLALWVAWLWPYLAMAWLMSRLARPQRSS